VYTQKVVTSCSCKVYLNMLFIFDLKG